MFHVAAMAVAPLSTVQAVLAGGVVMLAVVAERSFGLKISRRQWGGIVLTAVGLLLLGLSLPAVHGAHSRFSVPAMVVFEGALLVAGTLLVMGPRIGAPRAHHGFMLGAASGILFGVSDVAIKAISGEVGAHGLLGLATPWLLMAIVASVAAFYASAKGLQDGEAVPVIAITGTAANVAGIVGGIVVFGDPLSASPGDARGRMRRVRAAARRRVADAGAGPRRRSGRRRRPALSARLSDWRRRRRAAERVQPTPAGGRLRASGPPPAADRRTSADGRSRSAARASRSGSPRTARWP